MRLNFLLTFLCLVAIGAATQVSAQTESPENPLDRLSRPDYSRRQQATLEMWRQREESREKVQQAARDTDPEVAGRARWILRQWRRGALPDTPPEIARLLQRSQGPAAVEQLLEGGQFAAAIVAIEESAGTVEREAIQKRVVSALERRFPIYVHLALQSESLPELLELIEQVADSKELAVCRIELLQELNLPIDDNTLLPRSASEWSPVETRDATVQVLVALGRFDEAIDQAKNSADQSLVRRCQKLAGRWESISAESRELALDPARPPEEAVLDWTETLVAAERAEQFDRVEEALDQLKTLRPDPDSEAAAVQWKCLTSRGEIDAAIELAGLTAADSAASIAVDAGYPSRAVAVLSYDLNRLELDLDQWIDETIAVQKQSRLRELTQATRNLLALMHSLIAMGRHDAAFEIAEKLCHSDVTIGALHIREYVLSALTMSRRTDWLVQLAADPETNEVSQTSLYTVSRTLSDADAITMQIMMQALAIVLGNQTREDQFAAAYQLLDGEIPEGFDPESHFQRIYDYIVRPRPRRRGRQQFNGVLANLDFVRFFARHGQSELASGCLRQLIDDDKLDAVFFLAERELASGRADVAADLFEQVYRQVRLLGKDSSEVGTVDETVTAVKSVVGRLTLARRTGDQQQIEMLRRELRLSLCCPSTQLRYELAQYLGENGEPKLAAKTLRRLLPMAFFGNPDNTDVYDVARSYAMLVDDDNPAEAAAWFDLGVTSSFRSMSFRGGAYVSLPMYVHRWKLEAAIDRKDRQEAERQIQRILQLDWLDVVFAEQLLPDLREAGMETMADRALDQVLENGRAYSTRHPFDATTANNLAWVAAMNQRHLDTALELVNHAIFMEPESAVFRDTLAEVLFQQGKVKQALIVEESCLLDDADEWHYHEQIEKYREMLGSDQQADDDSQSTRTEKSRSLPPRK